MELLRVVQALSLAALVSCCSVPENYKSKTMLERAQESDLLVYGEVKEIDQGDTESYYKEMEYKVDVTCVLRNDMKPRPNIGGSISVFESDPPGECVSNKQAMVEGKKVILMLTEDYGEGGRLKFDNINVQGAVFEGNEDNLATIAGSCNFMRMMAPSDAANKECPVKAQRQACSYTSGASSWYSATLLLLCLLGLVALKHRL